ncbi:MAG TPA: hypothetical protein VH370_18595 [Humisphaera sp.]|jgi:tetratricopeptide (TPR) repeat protein|nr:hypothetical protein [Humisphaera sp.]
MTRIIRRNLPTGPAIEAQHCTRWIPLLLIALVLATFWPLLGGDFTSWDDYRAIVINPWLNPPAFGHLLEFWNPRHPYMDIWIPLTYTVWSALAAVSYVPTADPESGENLNPWIFHGANLAVHIASVLLVYAILRRTVKRPWPAAAGAALFALHPIQVEAVGWVAGMKDLLAGCLGLIAIWQYQQYAAEDSASSDQNRPHRLAHYSFATAAFVFAMLAKPSGIAVMLVVGACDLWIIERPLRKVVLALLPWLVLSIPIILEGRFAQPAAQLPTVPLAMRPLIAADALAFYLWKLFVPLKLAIAYDHSPTRVIASHWLYATWLVPVALAGILLLARRRARWLIGAVAILWLGVFPVLGLVAFDFQIYSTVADHYLYLAMLGPAVAVAFATRSLKSKAAVYTCMAILLALSARSWIQTRTWRDSVSLFQNAIAVNPNSCALYNNLAEAYRSKYRPEESLAAFEAGLKSAPDCAALRAGYAGLLASINRTDEARRQFQIVQKTATGDLAIAINQSLQRLNSPPQPTTTKSNPPANLTPQSAPIK